jgi:hypothetical protein
VGRGAAHSREAQRETLAAAAAAAAAATTAAAAACGKSALRWLVVAAAAAVHYKRGRAGAWVGSGRRLRLGFGDGARSTAAAEEEEEEEEEAESGRWGGGGRRVEERRGECDENGRSSWAFSLRFRSPPLSSPRSFFPLRTLLFRLFCFS